MLSTEDFEEIKDNNTDNLDATTKYFLKAISTSCKAMGHTEQAAKNARWHCFAMLDYFWTRQTISEYNTRMTNAALE